MDTIDLGTYYFLTDIPAEQTRNVLRGPEKSNQVSIMVCYLILSSIHMMQEHSHALSLL